MLALRVERIGEAVARSPVASLAAIVIVALVCFLPGFTSMGPMDGEEPGYAVAAREMVATGDYASVRLQTENDEWRPRGAYWIEALLVRLGGGDPPIWVNRLPSLVAGVGAALLTWWMAMAFGAPRMALIAGLFVAASGLVGLEARLASPDALGLAASLLCGGALARFWLGRKASDIDAALFWTGLGLGIITTGLPVPAVTVAAIAILSIEKGSLRWLMQLRPAIGLVWLFVIVSPWLIAVALALTQGIADGPSPDYLLQIGVPFHIAAPPGSYVLILPLLVGPAATFIFLGLTWFMAELRRPVVLFSLAWGGPLWLAAELVSIKEPQTVLPAVPAVALLAAAAIDAGATVIRGRVSWFYSLGPFIWPPLVAIVVPLVFFYLEGRIDWFGATAFLVAAILGPIAWFWIRPPTLLASVFLSAATVVFIYLGFFGSFVPGLSALRVGQNIAALAAKASPCGNPLFAATGYPEESLMLALGPATRLVDAWSAADFLNIPGCRLAAVDRSQIPPFHQRADDLGLGVSDLGHVNGFDLRKMHVVEVHLFAASGASE
jgi:4-amino-4-deoxy-L-arabinose transferase-like glycosyltransferase